MNNQNEQAETSEWQPPVIGEDTVSSDAKKSMSLEAASVVPPPSSGSISTGRSNRRRFPWLVAVIVSLSIAFVASAGYLMLDKRKTNRAHEERLKAEREEFARKEAFSAQEAADKATKAKAEADRAISIAEEKKQAALEEKIRLEENLRREAEQRREAQEEKARLAQKLEKEEANKKLAQAEEKRTLAAELERERMEKDTALRALSNQTQRGERVERSQVDRGTNDTGSRQGGWLFPYSSTTRFTRADLAGLSSSQLWQARNEIYARNGYLFSTERGKALAAALGIQGTEPNQERITARMNAVEKANIEMIGRFEK